MAILTSQQLRELKITQGNCKKQLANIQAALKLTREHHRQLQIKENQLLQTLRELSVNEHQHTTELREFNAIEANREMQDFFKQLSITEAESILKRYCP